VSTPEPHSESARSGGPTPSSHQFSAVLDTTLEKCPHVLTCRAQGTRWFAVWSDIDGHADRHHAADGAVTAGRLICQPQQACPYVGMTDAEQPTRAEALEFWNSLDAKNRQRLLNGIDPRYDTGLMQTLDSERMLFMTTDSADDAVVATAAEVASPEATSEAPRPSWVYAYEPQKVIDLGATDTVDG